jgi:hypothetical protein
MDDKKRAIPDDRTEAERRKNLTEEEIRELELAGGVEGGMQAGSAGGPGAGAGGSAPKRSSEERPATTAGGDKQKP